jgi:hypothetical protein
MTYLAIVIDLATRRAVDWAGAEHLRADGVDYALPAGLTRRKAAS